MYSECPLICASFRLYMRAYALGRSGRLGMNKKWRDALLVAARNLRQNVLKGRIWGADGSPNLSPSPSFVPGPIAAFPVDPSPSVSPTRSEGQFYSNPAFSSSTSSVESSASMSTGEEEGGEDA